MPWHILFLFCDGYGYGQVKNEVEKREQPGLAVLECQASVPFPSILWALRIESLLSSHCLRCHSLPPGHSSSWNTPDSLASYCSSSHPARRDGTPAGLTNMVALTGLNICGEERRLQSHDESSWLEARHHSFLRQVRGKEQNFLESYRSDSTLPG